MHQEDNLLIPENTSKQFFFMVDFKQPFKHIFSDLSENLKSILSLKKCILTVSHIDFQGDRKNTDVILYENQANKDISDGGELLSLMECIGKIPDPIRQHYNILLDKPKQSNKKSKKVSNSHLKQHK